MEGNDQLYLSHQALRNIGCLPENYPEAEVTNEKGKLRQVTEKILFSTIYYLVDAYYSDFITLVLCFDNKI